MPTIVGNRESGGIEPAGGYLYGNFTAIGEVLIELDLGLDGAGIFPVSEQDECRTQVDFVITVVSYVAFDKALEAVLRNEFL